MKDFLPGISFHSIVRDKKQVLFETVDGIISLDQLSDGYQNMAAWIGDLLYRITETFRDYNNPLSARGVLLIDEIDKADIEFPNDLLREIDRMEFYVYETRELIKAKHRLA